ncbi:hypothetical protein MMC11_008471 [Xylographa trunciseda]|nr:hypothetical protein [Xylographa trunciseda]
MAYLTVADHENAISGDDNEDNGSFFDNTFTIEDLEADTLFSPRHPEQLGEGRLVEDHNIGSLSHDGAIDTEEDCFMEDTTNEECQRVVEFSANPNLDSTCDQSRIRQSRSRLGISGPFSSEDHNTNVLLCWGPRTDTGDDFRQHTPQSSDLSTAIIYTGGLMPGSVLSCYGQTSNPDSHATTSMSQLIDTDFGTSFDYQMLPAWAEIDPFEIQQEIQPMESSSDRTLGISTERGMLTITGTTMSQNPDSEPIACQDLNLTMNNQPYDIAFGGHNPNAVPKEYQFLPVEYRPSLSDPYLFEGGFQPDRTAAVSDAGSRSLSSPLGKDPDQHSASDDKFIRQPATSYDLLAQPYTCAQIIIDGAANTFSLPPGLEQHQRTPFTFRDTLPDEEASGTNHRSSLQASNVGGFIARGSTTVGDVFWATPNPTTSTALAVDCESMQQSIEHKPSHASHERYPASIVQTNIEVTASTAQNDPEILEIGMSEQFSKSTALQSTRQPALSSRVRFSHIAPARRDIKASDNNSARLLQSRQQRKAMPLSRENPHKVSKCDRSVQQKPSKGLIRRRFQEHERVKVAKVRELRSCMMCRKQKAPASTTKLVIEALLTSPQCSEGKPFGRCVKAVGSAALAVNICVRDGLVRETITVFAYLPFASVYPVCIAFIFVCIY